MRAKRASFTFWVDKSQLKMPKMVHKTCSLRSNSVTRQVSFNRTKIGGKCQNQKIQMRHFGWFSNTVSILFIDCPCLEHREVWIPQIFYVICIFLCNLKWGKYTVKSPFLQYDIVWITFYLAQLKLGESRKKWKVQLLRIKQLCKRASSPVGSVRCSFLIAKLYNWNYSTNRGYSLKAPTQKVSKFILHIIVFIVNFGINMIPFF